MVESRLPVEWIAIGAGVIALGIFVVAGLFSVGAGLWAVYALGRVDTGWGMVWIGVALLAVPVALYGLGKGVGRVWEMLGR
ncbi:hypothetical protein [Halovivax cerinus]|uniref:Major facilitator superfamily (MFS) profile domain-containing protein n=1 Tax=Halovivax cerinus TaxID=1487865 RepID=A0ABD5NPP0_9EURY|nr:hypothetical protein [Halovivax cerinus]